MAIYSLKRILKDLEMDDIFTVSYNRQTFRARN